MEYFLSQMYQRRRLETNLVNNNESPSLELLGPRELSNSLTTEEIGATWNFEPCFSDGNKVR